MQLISTLELPYKVASSASECYVTMATLKPLRLYNSIVMACGHHY